MLFPVIYHRSLALATVSPGRAALLLRLWRDVCRLQTTKSFYLLSPGPDQSVGFISTRSPWTLSSTDLCFFVPGVVEFGLRFVQAEWRWRRSESGQLMSPLPGYFRISHSCSGLCHNLFGWLWCISSLQNTLVLKSCSLHPPAGLGATSPYSDPFC